MNNYRVDVVDAIPAGEDYTVPCGMNSIVYLADSQPNMIRLVKSLPELQKGKVYLYSKWDNNTRDYVVVSIIRKGNIK